MKEKLPKEKFISRLQREIECSEELLVFYETVYLPTLQKFDNKVYNIRFIKALQEQRTNDWMTIYKKENGHIVISLRLEKFNYRDCVRLYAMVYLNDEQRIDYEATISDELGKSWISSIADGINEKKYIIKCYDEMLAVAKECKEAIKKFKELPFNFQCNIGFCDAHYIRNPYE